MYAVFKNIPPGNVPKRGAASDATPPTPQADSVDIDPLVGADSRETKKLRTDRAAAIRALPAADVIANKDAIIKELISLRGVEPGWCHEEAGIMRSADGRVYEVTSSFEKRRAVAWKYVVSVIGAAAHLVICLLCFREV